MCITNDTDLLHLNQHLNITTIEHADTWVINTLKVIEIASRFVHDTVLVLIKLTKCAVALRCGSCKLIF